MSDGDEKKWKRKKKRSYLQRAKKFGRSGRFGQGRDIDRDTYDYFIRVMENMRDGQFQDDEAKSLFVANVFAQTDGEEAKLCGNQLASRVLQDLMPEASEAVRARFREALAEDLRLTALDPFASHVLETLMLLAVFQKPRGDPDDGAESSGAKVWVSRVCRFVVNNLGEFLEHQYASHVLRTALQCCAGARLDEGALKSKRQQRAQQAPNAAKRSDENLLTTVEPLDELAGVLESACYKARELEGKQELLKSETPSAMFQVLLACLAKKAPKHFQDLAKSVIEVLSQGIGDEDFQNVLDCEASSRLLESILSHGQGSPDLFIDISKKFFDGRLMKWATHPVGNFTVQRLLDACTNKEKFEKWYESELDENLEDILAAGSSGVVLSIAKACRCLSAKQAHFMVALMRSLHCYEPQQCQSQLAPLLVRMLTREAMEEAKGGSKDMAPVHIHGSLILQELLAFNKPIKAVTSLLSISPAELRQLLSDPRGSHVTDAFMASATIGEKSRDGLVKALKGELVQLACSKHGSRSVNAIWRHGSMKLRESLAAELATQESRVSSDAFGHHIAREAALSAFCRNREEWRGAIAGRDKRKELMRELLTDMNIEGKSKEHNADQVGRKGKKRRNDDQEAIVKTENADLESLETSTGQGKEVKEELVKEEVLAEDPPKRKKKKKVKVAKSYLDDL